MTASFAFMEGYEIYYNFIRKHQGIGCCPYELAITNLELGKNRWLDLIKMSKSYNVLLNKNDFLNLRIFSQSFSHSF